MSANARAGAVRTGAACFAALVAAAVLSGVAPATAATTTTSAPSPTTSSVPNATTTRPAPTSTTVPTSSTTTSTTPPSRTPSTSSSPTTTTTTPTATTEPPPGVTLISQPPWIPTHGTEVMKLHLDEPALTADPNAVVEVTIHGSVTARSDFDRAVTGESLGTTISRLTFPLSSLQINRHKEFLVGFGLLGSGATRTVGIDGAGVFPVEVRITDGGTSDRSSFVTWMVVVDQSAGGSMEPLRVSMLWQLLTGPLERADGEVAASSLAQFAPGGRLDHIATLLARAGNFPLSLGIGPETLEVWGREARTHADLERAVRRVRSAANRPTIQLLPEPYVPIAGPTIEAEGLGSHLPQEYVAGSNAVERATAQIPDPRTAFVDPVDEATVQRLTQMLVGRFVVRDTSLAPVVEPLTPAQPYVLTTGNGITAPAVATDSGLEQLVESTGPPALRVQRVLAALAEIAYEAPSQTRGVVLATPANWSPDVATITLLLRDLTNNPLVKPATLDTMFAEVAPADTDGVALQRRLPRAEHPGRLPLAASEYEQAARYLTAYALMVGNNDPSVAAGHQALLLSLSTDNTGPQALRYVTSIKTKLDEVTSGITTTAKALTLTARSADLPLSFQNNTGRDGVRIRVHLESPKLIFPKGADFILKLPRGHTTAKRNEFPVEARASGTFAMTITLESPDGTVQIGSPTRVTIRSAVFSGIGIALTLGALLFLAGWWGNHFRRTRRARRRALAR
jgi:hypothetical protein